MRSLPDDRTARARIRDEALRLFAERGPDRTTVRDIAAAAGVSPALVIRHYGAKDGLREAIDGYVVQVFESLVASLVSSLVETSSGERPGPRTIRSLAETVVAGLPDGSAVPAYLGRLLLDGGPAGGAVFGKLYAASRAALSAMAANGSAEPGADPDVRAAFLLVNDLAVLMLRERLHDVLGLDPLSAEGVRRWGTEVITVYRDGLGGSGHRDGPSYRDGRDGQGAASGRRRDNEIGE